MKNSINVLTIVLLVLMIIGMGVWFYKYFRFWMKLRPGTRLIRNRYNFWSKISTFQVLKDGRSWVFINPITDTFLFVKNEIPSKTMSLAVWYKDRIQKTIAFCIDFELDNIAQLIPNPQAIHEYLGVHLLGMSPVINYEAEILLEKDLENIRCEIRNYCATIPSEEFTIDVVEKIVSQHKIKGITMRVAKEKK